MGVNLVKTDWTIDTPFGINYSVGVSAVPINPEKTVASKALSIDMSLSSGDDPNYIQLLSNPDRISILPMSYQAEAWFKMDMSGDEIATAAVAVRGSELGDGIGVRVTADNRSTVNLLAIDVLNFNPAAQVVPYIILGPVTNQRVGLRIGCGEYLSGVSVSAYYNIEGAGWIPAIEGLYLTYPSLVGQKNAPGILTFGSSLAPPNTSIIRADDITMDSHTIIEPIIDTPPFIDWFDLGW